MALLDSSFFTFTDCVAIKTSSHPEAPTRSVFPLPAPAGLAPHLRPHRAPNSGRGGGIRTPIPGFGDRSPSRWTTPLKPKPSLPKLLHFLVCRVLAARVAKLPCLQTVGVLLLIFRRRVVAVLAIPALQRNGFPHDFVSLPVLLDDVGYRARAHGVAAFANRETQALLQRHRRNQ